MRMQGFLLCVAMGIAMNAMAVEFTFDTGAQGWTAGATVAQGMANFAASQGAIGFDYVAPTGGFDPIIISPTGLTIPAAQHHWLVLQVNITAAPASGPVDFQIFWATASQGFSEPQSRHFSVTPNLGWQNLAFDMALPQSTRDPWQGTVIQIRIDPGSSSTNLVGYHCAFDRIALTNDTDGDGINDDQEIYWFSNLDAANATTDHDNNGVPDAYEIAMGLNPLVDEGERLPSSSPWLLAALMTFVLAGGIAAIRRLSPRKRS